MKLSRMTSAIFYLPFSTLIYLRMQTFTLNTWNIVRRAGCPRSRMGQDGMLNERKSLLYLYFLYDPCQCILNSLASQGNLRKSSQLWKNTLSVDFENVPSVTFDVQHCTGEYSCDSRTIAHCFPSSHLIQGRVRQTEGIFKWKGCRYFCVHESNGECALPRRGTAEGPTERVVLCKWRTSVWTGERCLWKEDGSARCRLQC